MAYWDFRVYKAFHVYMLCRVMGFMGLVGLIGVVLVIWYKLAMLIGLIVFTRLVSSCGV